MVKYMQRTFVCVSVWLCEFKCWALACVSVFQCETKDSAEGALPNQGHAPGGEETLSSLSNLDAQSHKCSQKETNMSTCLAENTARAISSTWQHICAAKGKDDEEGEVCRVCILAVAGFTADADTFLKNKKMQATLLLLSLGEKPNKIQGKSTKHLKILEWREFSLKYKNQLMSPQSTRSFSTVVHNGARWHHRFEVELRATLSVQYKRYNCISTCAVKALETWEKG